MFNLYRAQAAHDIEWKPTRLQYIEAWKYDKPTTTTSWNIRSGLVDGNNLKEWLLQTGNFATPVPPPSAGTLDGGFRVLFSPYTSFDRVSLEISRSDFEAVEETFRLHPATLPALEVNPGTFSRHFQCSSSTTASDNTDQISIILKAPQKKEIGNYLLSLTHNFSSHWTTALIAGESIIDPSYHSILQSHSMEYLQHISFFTFHYHPASRTISAALLETAPHLWSHPLLLPSVLASDHLLRVRKFCAQELTRDVIQIERQLGVTYVGSRGDARMNAAWYANLHNNEKELENNLLLNVNSGPIERTRIQNLTIEINTQFTRVLFTKRCATWNHEVEDFLKGILAEINWPRKTYSRSRKHWSELLEHNSCLASSMEDTVKCLHARLDLQLNVLYSFVAQLDNRLNAHLAASSGRDSTSMKILALITTIFLPGTYVATLFSTSMFSWQTSSPDPNTTVASNFWIYWATTIPLTIVTLGGWGLWWNFEKRRYDVYTSPISRKSGKTYAYK